MDDKLFDSMLEGLEELCDDLETESGPAHDQIHFVDEPDPRAIRDELGLTQREFATLLDIPVTTLRNWEQGRRNPTGPAMKLLRLAKKNPNVLLPEEHLHKVTQQTQVSFLFKGLHSGFDQYEKKTSKHSEKTTLKLNNGDSAADDYSYAMAA